MAEQNHSSTSAAPVSRAVANHASPQGTGLPAVPAMDNQPDAIPQITPQVTDPVQKKANNTGLPDQLKSGIENLSGISMDDVKVQYNSDKPSQLQAHAYAQGTDIHIAPGQEQHLAHEAWHVVQQKQGRVQATTQKKGYAVNDNQSLESEATEMGNRAGNIPFQAKKINMANTVPVGQLVAQLALATVKPQNGPVNLEQVDKGGGFSVMQNPSQVDGKDVSNDIGYSGILDPTGWGDVGKSPAEYHRAHGYAKSVGGAGDKTNVGWWPKDKELEWTQDEENVKGAGQAQIPAWKPGVGEKGTYEVTRTDHPTQDMHTNYLTPLIEAMKWGMDDARDAWVRAEDFSKLPANTAKFPLDTVKAAKKKILDSSDKNIGDWLISCFGGTNVESNLIKDMKMDYKITTAGTTPGGSRTAFAKTLSAAAPTSADFGLKSEPEKIWKLMVQGNTGIFSKAGGALKKFVGRVVQKTAPYEQMALIINEDGFGLKKP